MDGNSVSWLRWIKCLCVGHKPEFVRNVYGDEIIALGYARSIWRCAYCHRNLFRAELHR